MEKVDKRTIRQKYSKKENLMKNPRRVAAGKRAYGRKKAAQDEADKPVLQFIGVVVVLVTLVGLFAFGGK